MHPQSFIKTFVVHLSTNVLRRDYMNSLIPKYTCLKDFIFMIEGDLHDIDEKLIGKYFGGKMHALIPAVSCAYKHILVYLKLVQDNHNDIYLVLEDDIYLSKDFCSKLKLIVKEIKERKINSFIISLEDSSLKYVKNSLRKKNVTIYKEKYGRGAGAYLVDKAAANEMISEINRHKCNQPIDWFHNFCSDKGIINLYWAHPTIATQGSINGKMKSIIDNKQHGKYRSFTFALTKLYKKMLYKLR